MAVDLPIPGGGPIREPYVSFMLAVRLPTRSLRPPERNPRPRDALPYEAGAAFGMSSDRVAQFLVVEAMRLRARSQKIKR
jgi:hypothetical protein